MSDEEHNVIGMAADIVSAYVANNSVSANDLPNFITQVHEALKGISTGASEAPAAPQTPAVSVRRSISPDFLICLEDGRKFKSLKRHLRTKYDLSPEDYRAKWGLPKTTRWSPRTTPPRARRWRRAWALAKAAGSPRRPRPRRKPRLCASPARSSRNLSTNRAPSAMAGGGPSGGEPPVASTTMVTVLPRECGSQPATMADAMAFATSSGAICEGFSCGAPNLGWRPGGNSSTTSRCPSWWRAAIAMPRHSAARWTIGAGAEAARRRALRRIDLELRDLLASAMGGLARRRSQATPPGAQASCDDGGSVSARGD